MRGLVNSYQSGSARRLRAPMEPLEQRFLLSLAVTKTVQELALMGPRTQAPPAPAVTDAKAGPLAKLGALLPLWNEYQQYVQAHGNADGFKPTELGVHMDGDGVLIEAY